MHIPPTELLKTSNSVLYQNQVTEKPEMFVSVCMYYMSHKHFAVAVPETQMKRIIDCTAAAELNVNQK